MKQEYSLILRVKKKKSLTFLLIFFFSNRIKINNTIIKSDAKPSEGEKSVHSKFEEILSQSEGIIEKISSYGEGCKELIRIVKLISLFILILNTPFQFLK